MAEKIKTWYIWAKNEMATNSLNSCEEGVRFCGEKQCTDGGHPLWEVSSEIKTHMEKTRATTKMDFRIYVQDGNGKIRPWAFEGAKSAAAKKTAREVQEKIAAHRARKVPKGSAFGFATQIG